MCYKNTTSVTSLLLLLLLTGFTHFPHKAVSKNLNAYYSYTVFYSPDNGPYIETYLSVAGNSVNFVANETGDFKAAVEVLVLFIQGKEVISYDKYQLSSPELKDTANINFSFLDQQRYSLPSGLYDFEIQIKDMYSDNPPFISLQPLEIDFPDDAVHVSGIQLIESYKPSGEENILTKHGYDLVPYISDFYPESVQKIIFYGEIYNTAKILGQEKQFLLTTYISPAEKNEPVTGFISRKREVTAPVSVVFNEFNISNLKSGNYFLVIEVRDQENTLRGKNRFFFQRSNPKLQLRIEDLATVNSNNTFVSKIQNADTLREYIRSLSPISDEQEKIFSAVHVKTADLETLQKYFYRFWDERNPLDPESAWTAYRNEVVKVNMAYSTKIQKGYETDRGRVYLQYGPPNAISESYNEPATYPYEIWHYYALQNGQRNRRFVFYTRDMVTNDFVMLHSDVSGELANYRWQYVLYQRVDPGFDLDSRSVPDSWGGQSRNYFDLPR
ncbi:MAG: GWxTD domain-containing protein [Bacteroidales bacterium]